MQLARLFIRTGIGYYNGYASFLGEGERETPASREPG
jgi:hypothetical protein